jgi:hypothetical protein
MSPRLAAPIAALAAGVGLAACGSSSKITVTQTVTTTVALAGNGPGNNNGKASSHGKSSSGGTASGTTGQSSQSPSQSGSGSGNGGGTGSGGGGTGQPASGGSGSSGGTVVQLSRHVVDNTERVHITSRQGALIIQEGVVTGAPIGNGTVVMRNRLTANGVVTSFTVRGSGGSVHGLANAALQVQGSGVHYRGTARITGGTGRFSRVRPAHLTVTGSGSLSGDTTLHVTGIEWY